MMPGHDDRCTDVVTGVEGLGGGRRNLLTGLVVSGDA